MLTTNECFIQNNTEVTFSSNVMGDITPWSKEELFSTQFWTQYSSRHYNNDHYQQLQVKTVQYAIYLSLKLSQNTALHVRYKQRMWQPAHPPCFFRQIELSTDFGTKWNEPQPSVIFTTAV